MEKPKIPEKLPVVFMFRPTNFEIVTPERFDEWAACMRDNVGLRAKLSDLEDFGTISTCGEGSLDD